MVGLTTVVETPAYLAKAGRLMSDPERARIVDIVAASPGAGVLIKDTRGLRKLRVPLAGRGKRGGGRLIYWYHSAGYPAVLLWMFAKNEAADLTAQQRRTVTLAAGRLLEEFGGPK